MTSCSQSAMYHTFDYSYFFRQTCVRCGRCRKSPSLNGNHIVDHASSARRSPLIGHSLNGKHVIDHASSVRRSPLIGTRILRETSAARLSPGRGFKLPPSDKTPPPVEMNQVLPPGGAGSDARLHNGRHGAPSDDDSGCALEEYAWLPHGLTPSQVRAPGCRTASPPVK